eukprot:Awhi_evm1s12865
MPQLSGKKVALTAKQKAERKKEMSAQLAELDTCMKAKDMDKAKVIIDHLEKKYKCKIKIEGKDADDLLPEQRYKPVGKTIAAFSLKKKEYVWIPLEFEQLYKELDAVYDNPADIYVKDIKAKLKSFEPYENVFDFFTAAVEEVGFFSLNITYDDFGNSIINPVSEFFALSRTPIFGKKLLGSDGNKLLGANQLKKFGIPYELGNQDFFYHHGEKHGMIGDLNDMNSMLTGRQIFDMLESSEKKIDKDILAGFKANEEELIKYMDSGWKDDKNFNFANSSVSGVTEVASSESGVTEISSSGSIMSQEEVASATTIDEKVEVTLESKEETSEPNKQQSTFVVTPAQAVFEKCANKPNDDCFYSLEFMMSFQKVITEKPADMVVTKELTAEFHQRRLKQKQSIKKKQQPNQQKYNNNGNN